MVKKQASKSIIVEKHLFCKYANWQTENCRSFPLIEMSNNKHSEANRWSENLSQFQYSAKFSDFEIC